MLTLIFYARAELCDNVLTHFELLCVILRIQMKINKKQRKSNIQSIDKLIECCQKWNKKTAGIKKENKV